MKNSIHIDKMQASSIEGKDVDTYLNVWGKLLEIQKSDDPSRRGS